MSSDWKELIQFQSTPLIRGATRVRSAIVHIERISIHAPHTRSDRRLYTLTTDHSYFNPRPSYEERRCCMMSQRQAKNFNPRPSYEERLERMMRQIIRGDFNPRPSYEERLDKVCCHRYIRDFNPRPSYEERHRLSHIKIHARKSFQSTLLIRGATAILSPLHFSSFHPPFSRTSSFPTSDISFLQQYLSSAFLCDSTSRASKESSVLPDHRCSLRRYVLSFPYNSSRDDKTADCLFSYRWPFRAYAGIPRTVLCRGCIRKQNSALFVRDARRSLLLA